MSCDAGERPTWLDDYMSLRPRPSRAAGAVLAVRRQEFVKRHKAGSELGARPHLECASRTCSVLAEAHGCLSRIRVLGSDARGAP